MQNSPTFLALWMGVMVVLFKWQASMYARSSICLSGVHGARHLGKWSALTHFLAARASRDGLMLPLPQPGSERLKT